jgi:Tol biopolymer transport system component
MPNNNEIIFFNKDRLDAVDLQKKTSRSITAEKDVRNVFNISDDGHWLVYGSMKNGTTDLRAMPLQGGTSIATVTSLHEDGHPFFSVDSKWLYYQRDHKNLFRVPGPAQNWRPDPPVQVTFFPESGLYLEDMQRTRDGKFLYYSRGRIRSDIWLLLQ